MLKKVSSILLVSALVMSLIAGCSPKQSTGGSESGGKKTYISIATGGPAGTYYPLGGAMAKIFNENVDGVTANAQSTGASIENIGLVSKGETEIAFVQNDITYYAFSGTESFEGKEKMENIRGMAMLYPELVQIVATSSSGIKSVEDLKGKKVAIGAPGSGVEANVRQVLAAHGMTYDDLGKADFLSFNEAADQLKNKQIDAAFLTAGVPTSAVTEVAQTSDIVVVPIASEKIAQLAKDYPFYTEVVIPKGTYKGQEADITTAAVMAMLVVPEDLDEDLAYNLTKSLFEKRQVIIDTHTRGNDIQLDTALKGMPIEVHPGSQRYYDEKGVK
ncbi:TAXI family TRAP transporter solute-binding subunit [Alkaliphilus sp. MSJ-5]|uniref:TAXI family TRAP transporter solute-binding subunit n=1 Tax=Alkaliphilus flagellatus TaxID=2841507 RepID=A0ABS6FYQ3_9FIRM|nr:TAXI family TRAP transporter solute-binding subunit [Alkaliphilus flagellatus]MBU5675194.1 TAXI family TRAP transporter solute-binding subunit [Alkaliphilus flagellatus]